ncbi:HesA/MoeB/ThiF family protein [Pseudarthrobacter sp. NPDC058329]|uniref:HesA/MoeB/ThiF family protein n=1 Tax=Pseudarthrobacter sp. NPDC058329 TaxID=3346448 RepID=UPI0036DF519A
MITADFVLEQIDHCAAEGLAYVAVHCHGGTESVEFSDSDMRSHERGYPALLDITGGPAVGALVLTRKAAAGDIWLPGGTRIELDHLSVVGRPQETLRPHPISLRGAAQRHDRQVRIFGEKGQDVIGRQKVAIVGLGGGGSLINEYLSRLGVGHLVLIDPEKIAISNLSRVVGSTRRDAHTWLGDESRPRWMQKLADRFATPKVAIAARVARQASKSVRVEQIVGDVTNDAVAQRLVDCDYIFLAADSMQARLVVSAVSHQYLIPMTQVGAKVSVDGTTGNITNIFSVVRSSEPGSGCLWCNGLISASRLQEEATAKEQLQLQRYVDEADITAPSVITLNAVAAAHAVDDYMMTVTGLLQDVNEATWYKFFPQESDVASETPRKDSDCFVCGPPRFGKGSLGRLPTK